jgi:hypothetical protein
VKRSASIATLLPFLGGLAVLFFVPWFWARWEHRHLGDPAFVTGWWLFAIMLLLSAFNARKRLAMLPLGRASVWLHWHVGGGFLALALFWLHGRVLWPLGLHEQALALAFYLLTISGIVGWLLQRIYPRQLSDTGREIIFERIPAEIARLRESAEQLVLDCTRGTGSDTVARHYMETLHWFFRRPRFFLNHALFGGKEARDWTRRQCEVIRPHLDEKERGFLDRLHALADEKATVDFHFAAQSLMKRWLLLHLPLAAMTMLLALWHVLLVYAYGR